MQPAHSELGTDEVERQLGELREELRLALARVDRLMEALDPPLSVVVAPSVQAVPSDEQVARSEVRERLLVPVLPFRDELTLRGLVLLGIAATCWFWAWWIGSGHGEWTTPAVLVTVLFAWVTLLSLYFFFFVARMTKPNPALPIPDLRVAMVVTKAPSEPWPVLRRTLEAMLAQDYPHPYDVWLADERPDEETLRWCAEHGVAVSTRFGVAEYHQPSWPRRTKCKEGNLAYFYDTVGYANYDVVSQLDADDSYPYVTHAFWYSFRNNYWSNNDQSDVEANYGLTRVDFSVKPAYAAFKSVAGTATATTTTTAPTTTTTTSVPASTTTTTAAADRTAPVISGLAAKRATTTTARVTWLTNEPADSVVDVWKSGGAVKRTTMTGKVTSHNVTVSGLSRGSTYNVRVMSTDAAGNTATSGTITFRM